PGRRDRRTATRRARAAWLAPRAPAARAALVLAVAEPPPRELVDGAARPRKRRRRSEPGRWRAHLLTHREERIMSNGHCENQSDALDAAEDEYWDAVVDLEAKFDELVEAGTKEMTACEGDGVMTWPGDQ